MTTAMVCIDANFVVRFLASSSTESIYQQHWSQWQTAGYTIVAPTLIIYEVCNAFHRAVVAGQITQEESEQFLERALNLGKRLSIEFWTAAQRLFKAVQSSLSWVNLVN